MNALVGYGIVNDKLVLFTGGDFVRVYNQKKKVWESMSMEQLLIMSDEMIEEYCENREILLPTDIDFQYLKLKGEAEKEILTERSVCLTRIPLIIARKKYEKQLRDYTLHIGWSGHDIEKKFIQSDCAMNITDPIMTVRDHASKRLSMKQLKTIASKKIHNIFIK